jgi:hypothetical protein
LRQSIAALDRPQAVVLPVARKAATVLRAMYRRADRKGNRLGGQRTHWWRSVAQSVQAPVLLGRAGAMVQVTQPGIALQAQGGTVRPREKKALALPVRAEAHGVYARDWTNRFPDRPLFKVPGRRPFLAYREPVTGALRVAYVLRRAVRVPADPRAVPGTSERAEILAYARRRLEEVLRRRKPSP